MSTNKVVRKRKANRVRGVRGTIYFSGNVQKLGFRAMVEDVANMLLLNGYVENLNDRRVKVIVEGPKPAILKLVETMRNADDMINVERITCRYSAATGEFTQFEVKYEDLAKEMFQGFATAAKYLSIVRDEVKGVGNQVKGVGNQVKGVGNQVKEVGEKVEEVGEKIDNMHDDMNKRFLEMNEKYHVISEVLIAHTDALTKLVKDYIETKEKKAT